jgi:Multiubiquitin
VNAREDLVESRHLSYAQVVRLAFNPVPVGPDIIFTVTYRKGPHSNPKGTLSEGESVTIKNGMIFVVTQTNRS